MLFLRKKMKNICFYQKITKNNVLFKKITNERHYFSKKSDIKQDSGFIYFQY
jgi:hypothetical protein